MRLLAILAVVILSACVGGSDTPASSPTSAPSRAPSALPTVGTIASASPSPAIAVRALLPPAADELLVSADGSKMATRIRPGAGAQSTGLVIQAIDGTQLGKYESPRGIARFEWLPDSSGLFVEAAAGLQRSGPLVIVGPNGNAVESGLDYADPSLSPDGMWVAAARQEGCCVAIKTHEISVAPRAGGVARTLATTRNPDQLQPMALLGWDERGRVVFRDGGKYHAVALDGARAELPAPPDATTRRPVLSAVSPDGKVLLICASDPTTFWTVAGGRVAQLSSSLEPAWRLRTPLCSRPDEVAWIGGHDLAVRGQGGALSIWDPLSGSVRPMPPTRAHVVFSASGDEVLVAVGDALYVASAMTSNDRAVGLKADRGSLVMPIRGGRFVVQIGPSYYLVN